MTIPTAATLIANSFKAVDWSLVNSAVQGFESSTSGVSITGATGAPSAGQLDVLFITTDATETVVVGGISPGTWVAAHAASGSSQSAYVFYRIATGTEGAGLKIAGGTGTLQMSVNWSRWNGSLAASPLDVFVAGSTTATKAISSTASSTLASAGELVLAFAGIFKTAAAYAPTSPVWTGGFTALNTTPANFQEGSAASAANFGAFKVNPATTGATAGLSWTAGSNATEIQPIVVSFKPIAPAAGVYTRTSGTGVASIDLAANQPGTGYFSVTEATPGTPITGSDYAALMAIINPLIAGSANQQVDAFGLVSASGTL